MSKSTITTALGRIKDASPESPIAVFEHEQRGCFETVFADTIESRRQLALDPCPGLVGVFHRDNYDQALAAMRRSL